MENMTSYISTTNAKDIIDMDTQERIRRVSDSSMGGTSGYNSTTSPGLSNSPISVNYSPVQSPDLLHNAFSNLAIPSLSYQQNSPQYVQLQNVHLNINNNTQNHSILYQQNQNMNFSPNLNFGNPLNYESFQKTVESPSNKDIKYEYEATLRITEQPAEKFRFRYKSEMHGTHGSLNGTNSQRSTKSFPEVELCGYKGEAIIRCSLFQTNLESPHSHQLVVRKDDHDICDPHELKVCQKDGYFAEFKNMGIIHTAKKFIVEELLKKKRKRLYFELGRDVLTSKEEQELYKQTEKEAKDMNLNQVRLCFEAFRVEENNSYTPIASPIYSNLINNRKSAQTGELRITRLSIATGSVAGGDDLILLVEKVSKKNIKVRFYEMVDDEQVWEAFANFRESDVHHQYAIVCRTPAYKDKNIDKPVEVFIELVRPSDDERSYPPVSFRYKPNYAVTTRKRRRACSSLINSSCSNSGSLSSGEIPKTVQEQQQSPNISCTSEDLQNMLKYTEGTSNLSNCSEIIKLLQDDGYIEKDGACAGSDMKKTLPIHHYKKLMINKKQMDIAEQSLQQQHVNIYLKRILHIFEDIVRNATPDNSNKQRSAVEQIEKIFHEYLEKNGESLIHEIVLTDNNKLAIPIFKIFEYFKLRNFLNSCLNKRSQTPLHYCCLYNQPNYIRPLLKLGCIPDIQDTDGNTALHIAVRENHLKCLESFINSAVTFNLNIKNDDGFTPLHLAIRNNNCEIVAKLLKHDKTTVNVPYSKDGNNALHMVIQQQNIRLVRLVLDNKALVASILYANNAAGDTPLDLAKQFVSNDDQAQQILNLLLTYYNKYPSGYKTEKNEVNTFNSGNLDKKEIDDDNKLVIKEENSSSEDDEEDNNDGIDNIQSSKIVPIAASIVKQEYFDETTPTIEDLKAALNNKDISTSLCVQLNKNEKWKRIATEMKMYCFYLTNAEGFLNLLKRNIESINCEQFASAIEKVDPNLITIIRKQ